MIGQPRATFRRVEMASTAGAVLRRAQCPVLTIPAAPSSRDIARVSTGILAAQSEPRSSQACEPTDLAMGVPLLLRDYSDRLRRSNGAVCRMDRAMTEARHTRPHPSMASAFRIPLISEVDRLYRETTWITG